MITKRQKRIGRLKRHKRIRNKVMGTKEKPRLSVFCSHKNMYIQLIDDIEEKTILSCSTLNKNIKKKIKQGGGIKAVPTLGEEFAKIAQSKGVKRIVFDRGGYLYHGRVKALAEVLRKEGLQF